MSAGLNEGRNAKRESFLPWPRIQIVTEGVFYGNPSNLSSQNANQSSGRPALREAVRFYMPDFVTVCAYTRENWKQRDPAVKKTDTR
jgi:hypothetical protein